MTVSVGYKGEWTKPMTVADFEKACDRVVDMATGELGGQLMLGIEVPAMPVVEIQRRGTIRTDEVGFNQVHWRLDEGDKLSVTVKDGVWLVRLAKGWEQE